MLHIDKINIELHVHELAVANNVTDAQMASFIFRNLYKATNNLAVAKKIHRHSVAITNLSNELI